MLSGLEHDMLVEMFIDLCDKYKQEKRMHEKYVKLLSAQLREADDLIADYREEHSQDKKKRKKDFETGVNPLFDVDGSPLYPAIYQAAMERFYKSIYGDAGQELQRA